MDYRPLGRTGLRVSRLALGCGTFGGIGTPLSLVGRGLDEETAFAALDEAVALGITLFDTAWSYAGGASDRILGRWLSRQAPAARAGLLIETKVGMVSSPEGTLRVDLSPRAIREHLSRSLDQLGVDRVPLCLSHAPDPTTPIEATLEGFAAQIESGRVEHVGGSNLTPAQLREALEASGRLGVARYEWVQNAYNLLDRRAERELAALCREHELGFTPFSPIAGGILTGKYRAGESLPADSRLALRPDGSMPGEATFAAIERLRARADTLGVATGALALAWTMSHPQVTAPIVGPSRRPEHLRLAREALAIRMDPALRDEIGGWFAAEAG